MTDKLCRPYKTTITHTEIYFHLKKIRNIIISLWAIEERLQKKMNNRILNFITSLETIIPDLL